MLSALLLLYDHQLEHEGTTSWDSLLWVVNQLWAMHSRPLFAERCFFFLHDVTKACINNLAQTDLHLSSLSPSLPQLIEIVGRINVTSSTCVHEFSRFFWRFCRTFGKIFTSTKVKISFRMLTCDSVIFIYIEVKTFYSHHIFRLNHSFKRSSDYRKRMSVSTEHLYWNLNDSLFYIILLASQFLFELAN